MNIFEKVVKDMDQEEVMDIARTMVELVEDGVEEQAAPHSEDPRLVQVGQFMERVTSAAIESYGFNAVVKAIIEADVEKDFNLTKAEQDGWPEHWPSIYKVNKAVMEAA